MNTSQFQIQTVPATIQNASPRKGACLPAMGAGCRFRPLAAIGALALATVLLASGCASVPMQSQGSDARAKRFDAPPPGYSGLYLYRDACLGTALKRALYVDGQYVGRTGYKTYFHRLLKPGAHTLQTESEWGQNETVVDAVEGQNLFVRQSILIGVFSARSKLAEVPRETGERAISKLRLAADMDDRKRDLKDAQYGESSGSVPASEILDRTEPLQDSSAESADADSPPEE